MGVDKHSPYPKTQQRHRQGHFIQVHIPLISNFKDTGEEPSSLHNSKLPNTHMQHGYKIQHSTVTALHTLNNTVAKGFNQMPPPPCANNHTVAFDMSKAFDTINIHTLIRKLLQTHIPGTILKSFHPKYLTFTPQTYHQPVHRFRSWVMAYADTITITSTHTSTSAAKKYIQPYIQ